MKLITQTSSSRALEHAEFTVWPSTLLASASCCCAKKVSGRAGGSHIAIRQPTCRCTGWTPWLFTETWAICSIWPLCWGMFNDHRCSKQSWLYKVLCIAQGIFWLLQHICKDVFKNLQLPSLGLEPVEHRQLQNRISPAKQLHAGRPRTWQCKHSVAVA